MQTTTITKRAAADRGTADHGWLNARFTFSFAEYFDPDHMGFKSLRVINNDTVEPGGGFPTHPHKSMEIFTYVVEGQLEHRDSMGNGAIIEAGDLQYMSAGDGILHSEFNPSRTDRTILYQIWITPTTPGGKPRYAEKPLRQTMRDNELKLLFSGDGRDGSTEIRQDAEIHFGQLKEGHEIQVPGSSIRPDAWIQVISGQVSLMGESLEPGDGLSLENVEGSFTIRAGADAKFLLFRLA